MKILNKRGTIEISNDVIAVIAGYAALNCMGVKGMTRRNMADGIAALLLPGDFHRGVKVTPDCGSLKIELHIAVDSNVNIQSVARSTMSEVKYRVEQQTGLAVTDVRIFVDAIVDSSKQQ